MARLALTGSAAGRGWCRGGCRGEHPAGHSPLLFARVGADNTVPA